MNGYLLDVIFQKMNIRINNLIHNKFNVTNYSANNARNDKNQDSQGKKFFCHPVHIKNVRNCDFDL